MKTLLGLFLRVWRPHFGSLLVGCLLSVLVLAAGTALLGLSGWFITATGMAGLAGVGIAFDVFRPSAAIRFLALGRAAARYGERVLNHDATLKGLATLRGRLLAAMTRAPLRALAALRGSERLHHLTLDVDALDGLALRLVIPFVSAVVVLSGFLGVIWWLESGMVALVQALSYLVGLSVAVTLVARSTMRPSRMAQKALQSLRLRYIELIRARTDLMVSGSMAQCRTAVLAAQNRLQVEQDRIDRTERVAGFILNASGSVAASISLYLGIRLSQAHAIDPALAAFGFFTALALTEGLAPLHRGLTELGRMTDAARRVSKLLDADETRQQDHSRLPVAAPKGAPVLMLSGVSYHQSGRTVLNRVSLTVNAGETVALTGPSGVGKSTALMLALGQLRCSAGRVLLCGTDVAQLTEDRLFSLAAMLPQRSALMAGTIMEALRLADGNLAEDEAWRALAAVQLDRVIVNKGGLQALLGESGAGLSGGESRRLTLARVLLRRPALLLLDEPTEGLDAATAVAVLQGVRAYLPQAAIVMASHRALERDWADRIVAL